VADYVLVHGAQKDSSIWDRVAMLLAEHGHGVFAPTLSAPSGSTLAEHVSEVCELIRREELKHVILVGHSYASFVITGVADRIPSKVDRLVYVDSAIPVDGASLYGMFKTVGVASEDYDLPQDPPFLEPLYFDEERIREIPKVYIHCTHSEFIFVARPFFEKVIDSAGRDNWECHAIESDHACMISHPEEIAGILMLDVD